MLSSPMLHRSSYDRSLDRQFSQRIKSHHFAPEYLCVGPREHVCGHFRTNRQGKDFLPLDEMGDFPVVLILMNPNKSAPIDLKKFQYLFKARSISRPTSWKYKDKSARGQIARLQIQAVLSVFPRPAAVVRSPSAVVRWFRGPWCGLSPAFQGLVGLRQGLIVLMVRGDLDDMDGPGDFPLF